MVSSINSALTAYQNQLKLMQNADDTSAATDANQPSFASMVEDAIHETTSSIGNAEALQMKDASGTGKVDLTDLVTAVSNAEITLNTVVAVRDKVISAYQSIIGMSI